MPDPDPRAFIAEYVEPAIAAFKADQTVKHLAAHALAQVDILAAVVANHQLLKGRAKLDQGEERAFRRDLEQRIPVLRVVNDAHDAHKHGRLGIQTWNFAGGLQPETRINYGIFANAYFAGGSLLSYIETMLTLADGSEVRVDTLLHQAMVVWHEELNRLGI